MKYLLLGLILVVLIFILKTFKEKFNNDGIFQRTPLRTDSLFLNDQFNLGVLVNLRSEFQENTFSKDLDYNDMNRLFNKIIGVEFFFRHDDNLELDLSKNIIERINQFYDKFELNSEFHPNDKRKYKLVNYDLLIKEKISRISNKSIINIKFYKDMKDVSFTIQIDVTYSEETLGYVINKIDIISIDLNEHILLKNKYFFQKYCSLDQNSSHTKCHQDTLLNKKELNTFFSNILKNNNKHILSENEKIFLKKKEDEKKKHEEYQKYKCFGKDGFNESTCRSYSFKNQRVGIWDKPCNKDQECPFYRINKNYPNKRGGCLNGYCEVPVNIKRLGFKKYDLQSKPFCHNCNKKDCLGENCFTCCDEQKNPDYMFKNDSVDRKNFFK